MTTGHYLIWESRTRRHYRRKRTKQEYLAMALYLVGLILAMGIAGALEGGG